MTSIWNGKSKDIKYFRFAWESLELKCEWQDCDSVESEIPSFLTHVTQHLEALAEEDFSCKWKDCGATLTDPAETCRHIYFHAFHTKIKCFGKNVMLRKKLPTCSLDQHNRNVIPDLPDKLLCCWDICEDAYNNPELFYRHVDAHAENNPKGNNLKEALCCHWQGCSRYFSSLYKLREHLRAHTQEKSMACPTCGGMFASRTKFVDHLQRQISLQDAAGAKYTCEYCSRSFPTVRLLRDHMRQHVNHYKCPFCDMTCPAPSALELHMTYRHSTERPYSCEYCDYRCKAQNDLAHHIETHNSEAWQVCPACNYSSKVPSSFHRHIRSVHGGERCDSYMCHICTKTFTRGYHLTRHLIRVHQFHWPSGHMRFRYHRQADGYYRLQTVRYESVELSESMMQKEKKTRQARQDQIDTDESSSSNDSTVPHANDGPEAEAADTSTADDATVRHFSSVGTSLEEVPFILCDPAKEAREPGADQEGSLLESEVKPVHAESLKADNSEVPSVSLVLWNVESGQRESDQSELQIVDADGNRVMLVQVEQELPANASHETVNIKREAEVSSCCVKIKKT